MTPRDSLCLTLPPRKNSAQSFHALQQTRKPLILETPINVPVLSCSQQSVRGITSHPSYSLQLPQHPQKVDVATREARRKLTSSTTRSCESNQVQTQNMLVLWTGKRQRNASNPRNRNSRNKCVCCVITYHQPRKMSQACLKGTLHETSNSGMRAILMKQKHQKHV